MIKLLLFASLFLGSALSTVVYTTNMGQRDTPLVIRTPRVYDIDLDASYEDRWRPIVNDYRTEFHLFLKSLDLQIETLLKVFDKFDYPIISGYNKEFAKEIKALANLSNVSFTLASALNFLYEASAQCTSIIVQDPDGNIYMGRNLDFDFAPYLGNLTFHGRYFRKGKLIYESIGVVGYTGVITAIRPGAYSFSIDQYLLPKEAGFFTNMSIFLNDVAQLMRRKLSPPYVARMGIETIPDYDGFVNYLKETDTVSNVYYIVAGTKSNQGVVITKYRSEVQSVFALNVQEGRWYVTQTNYERDDEDPDFDNRCTAAKEWLDRIGWNGMTQEKLDFQVMQVYPVFNNLTIHTTIMQPSTGLFRTTLWY